MFIKNKKRKHGTLMDRSQLVPGATHQRPPTVKGPESAAVTENKLRLMSISIFT